MGTCCVKETIVVVNSKANPKLPANKTAAKPSLTKRSTLKKSARGSIYQTNLEDIKKVYKFCSLLGSGYFGIVRSAKSLFYQDKVYGVKSINKVKLPKESIGTLSKEIEVLAELDHPNIIKYYETYEDENDFHIVMELCTGGELYDRIVKRKYFSEKETVDIIYKITSAISHCHANGIVHRDLKPENILYENNNENADLKIIDFGLSKKFKGIELNSIVGSPYYVAPEILEGKYDSKCDIWAIGIIMYILLCVKLLFKMTIIQNYLRKLSHLI